MNTVDGRDAAIAAAELFATRGYDTVTMAAIAKRAGCARRTLFARYGTKTGLLTAIVDLFFEHVARFLADLPPVTRPKPRASCRSGRASPGSRPRPSPRRLSGADPLTTTITAAAAACRDARCVEVARVALGVMNAPWLREPTRVTRTSVEMALQQRLFRTRSSASAPAVFYARLQDRLEELVRANGVGNCRGHSWRWSIGTSLAGSHSSSTALSRSSRTCTPGAGC